jgi:hypothetical protein
MDTIFNKIDHFFTHQCNDYDELDETQPEHKALLDAIDLLVEIQQSPPAFTPYLKHDGLTKMHGSGPRSDITDTIFERMNGVELMPGTRIKRVMGRVYLEAEKWEDRND